MDGGMNMVRLEAAIRGGVWGLLVGDALGVPYEFHSPGQLPRFDELEMTPPTGFRRAHHTIRPATWSDDGAQALCLLDSLLNSRRFDERDFADRLLLWRSEGLWAIDRYVFDVGNQTDAALAKLRSGTAPTESGFIYPNGKGNGALMRVLPLALWHTGSAEELIEDAHRQAVVTHGHITNQVCCALYCLWARSMLQGQEANAAYAYAVTTLSSYYKDSAYGRDLQTVVRPTEDPTTDGSGYIVATLNAARIALEETNYEAVVKRAISYGHDTDTNAAVAGGLAGIRDGVDGIPSRWLKQMRGQRLVEKLLDPLLKLRVRV